MNDLAIESALENGLEPNTEDNYENEISVDTVTENQYDALRKQNANDGYDRFVCFWNGYQV